MLVGGNAPCVEGVTVWLFSSQLTESILGTHAAEYLCL